MQNLSLILHNHSGHIFKAKKPSPFAAEHMKPIVDCAIAEGKTVHVVHDRILVFEPLEKNPRLLEEILGGTKTRREFKAMVGAWTRHMKSQFSALDNGTESQRLNRETSPEVALIIETNRKHPGTIRNHFNYTPFEAVVEFNHAVGYEFRVYYSILRGEMEKAVEHMTDFHDHFTDAMLIRDGELVKQVLGLVKRFSQDPLVVLRGTNHVHFEALLRQAGLDPAVATEDVERTFRDEAIEGLASGGLSEEERRRLAILHIIYIASMNISENKHSSETKARCRQVALEGYDELYSEIYGDAKL